MNVGGFLDKIRTLYTTHLRANITKKNRVYSEPAILKSDDQNSTYTESRHLIKVSFPDKECIYLLICNRFTDPKSIKENGYFEVCRLANVQLHLITKHYVENVLHEPFWKVKQIGEMQEPPFGNTLYEKKVIKNVSLLVLRDSHGTPIFAGDMEKDEFVEEFIRDGDELYGEYSDTREEVRSMPIESYIVTFIPTVAYLEVFDMDRYFYRYTRYDYENKVWVPPNIV